MESRQSVTVLSFALNGIRERIKAWKNNGGEPDSLEWKIVNASLATTDLGSVIGSVLPCISIALIRVTGNIAPHKHLLSNSAGVLLGEAEGFSFPPDPIETLLDDGWHSVHVGDLLVLTAGSPHGFRGVLSAPLFALFLDSPPIDDATDHILVEI
ncbi:MAG: hypothetical protein WDN10_04970 [bacterium]